MKRYLTIVPLLILLCATVAYSWLTMGPTQPTSVSCTVYDSYADGDDNHRDFGRVSTYEYGGSQFNDTAATGTICQVAFKFFDDHGTPTLNDYYAEIWLMDGDNLTGSALARSNKVDGAAWDAEWQIFVFPTPYTYLQNTNYGIVVKSIDNADAAATIGESDGTNYTSIAHDTDDSGTPANYINGVWHWNAANLAQTYKTLVYNNLVKVYTQ